jgi:hypothetical protein
VQKVKEVKRTNSESKSTPVEIKLDDGFPQHSTIDCEYNSFIRMDDLCAFRLVDSFQYLNVNVFGKSQDDNRLLGYLNIPLNSILVECGESNLGHYRQRYSLLPPESIDASNHPLSTQSGFDQSYCYGDVLFSFLWSDYATSPDLSVKGSRDNMKKLKLLQTMRGSTDRLDDDRVDIGEAKAHDFIRTHFHRTTQCDYCGKKIWLKDAVQCRYVKLFVVPSIFY